MCPISIAGGQLNSSSISITCSCKRGDAHGNLERRAGRIRGAVGARKQRNLRIVLKLLERFRGDVWDEAVRVDRRPGSHGQDVAIVRIEDDQRAAFHALFQDLLAKPLQLHVERGDDIVSGLRRDADLLARLFPVRIEGDVVLALLALKLVVEGLLQPFAAFRTRPEHFVVLNRPVGDASPAVPRSR